MLNDDPAQLHYAVTAISSLNPPGIDPRDVLSALSQICYVGKQLKYNLDECFRIGVEVADPTIAETLTRSLGLSARINGDSYCLASISTRRGRILVRRGLHRGVSTFAIETAAVEIAEMLSADGYAPMIKVAADPPRFWLSGIEDDSLDDALRFQVASVEIKGESRLALLTSAPFQFPTQLFVVWILEMSTASAAEVLSAIAARKSATPTDVACLSLSSGRLFALLIARSTVVGQPSKETSSSMLRFANSMKKILDVAVREESKGSKIKGVGSARPL